MAMSKAEEAYVEWAKTDPSLLSMREQLAISKGEIARAESLIADYCGAQLGEFERLYGDVTL